MKNVRGNASDEDGDHVTCCRPLVDSIGSHTTHQLKTACDKHDGSIDNEKITQETNSKTATVATLLTESVFHSAGGVEGDGLDNEKVYVDVGDDSDENLMSKLKKVDERKRIDTSVEGLHRLSGILF